MRNNLAPMSHKSAYFMDMQETKSNGSFWKEPQDSSGPKGDKQKTPLESTGVAGLPHGDC